MALHSELQRSFEWDRPWRVGLIIPTCNAGFLWSRVLEAIAKQTLTLHRRLVIDSESHDTTLLLARRADFDVLPILRKNFRHGAARQLGVEYCHDCDILIFMTQDAILHDPEALSQLCEVFQDHKVATAYGRQLPHGDADFYAKTLRQFNYGESSYRYTFRDRQEHGFQTIFNSNSFAAYRRDALIEVGGFNRDTLVSEDVLATAALLKADYQVAYVSDALVEHSHNYSWREEFSRYFDIGVTHAMHDELLKNFGQPTQKGVALVMLQVRVMIGSCFWWVPGFIFRTLMKYLAYQLGKRFEWWPTRFNRLMSGQATYWRRFELPD